MFTTNSTAIAIARRERWGVVLAMTLLASSLGASEQKAPETPDSSTAGHSKATRVWKVADAPRRHPESAFREVGDDGGLVVLPSRSEVKVLNPTGIRVFSLLDGKHTLGAIAHAVTDEFEVDYVTALKDVIGFVKELDASGMLADEEPVAAPK